MYPGVRFLIANASNLPFSDAAAWRTAVSVEMNGKLIVVNQTVAFEPLRTLAPTMSDISIFWHQHKSHQVRGNDHTKWLR